MGKGQGATGAGRHAIGAGIVPGAAASLLALSSAAWFFAAGARLADGALVWAALGAAMGGLWLFGAWCCAGERAEARARADWSAVLDAIVAAAPGRHVEAAQQARLEANIGAPPRRIALDLAVYRRPLRSPPDPYGWGGLPAAMGWPPTASAARAAEGPPRAALDASLTEAEASAAPDLRATRPDAPPPPPDWTGIKHGI